MKVRLFLTLKKEWFDKIYCGEKTEEYRKITPRYIFMFSKHYDYILFQNGYRLSSPRLYIELKQIIIKDDLFVLQLGKIIPDITAYLQNSSNA